MILLVNLKSLLIVFFAGEGGGVLGDYSSLFQVGENSKKGTESNEHGICIFVCLFIVLFWNCGNNGASDRGSIHLSVRIDVSSLLFPAYDFELCLSLVSLVARCSLIVKLSRVAFVRQV